MLDLRNDGINSCRHQAILYYLDIFSSLPSPEFRSSLSAAISTISGGSEGVIPHFYYICLASVLLHSLTVPCVSVASVICETITYLPDRLLSTSRIDSDSSQSEADVMTKSNEAKFCALVSSSILSALTVQSCTPDNVPARLWVKFLVDRNILKERKSDCEAVSIEMEEHMEGVLAFRNESAVMVLAIFRGDGSTGGWVGGQHILTLCINQLMQCLNDAQVLPAVPQDQSLAPVPMTDTASVKRAYALAEMSLHLFSHLVDEANVAWALSDDDDNDDEGDDGDEEFATITSSISDARCLVLLQLVAGIRAATEWMDSQQHLLHSATSQSDENSAGSSIESLAFYFLELWQFAPAVVSLAWTQQPLHPALAAAGDLSEPPLLAIRFMCQCLGVDLLRVPAAEALLALVTSLHSRLTPHAQSICTWLSHALTQADTQHILRGNSRLAENLHACHSRMACAVADPHVRYQIFSCTLSSIAQGLGAVSEELGATLSQRLAVLDSPAAIPASVSTHTNQLLVEVIYLQRSLIGFVDGFCLLVKDVDLNAELQQLISLATECLLQLTRFSTLLLVCITYSSGGAVSADEELVSNCVSVISNGSFAINRLANIHLSKDIAYSGLQQTQSIVYNAHVLLLTSRSMSRAVVSNLCAVCRSLLQLSKALLCLNGHTAENVYTVSSAAVISAILNYATTLLRAQSQSSSTSPLQSKTVAPGTVNESSLLLLQECVKCVRDISSDYPPLLTVRLPYLFAQNQSEDPFYQYILPAVMPLYSQVLASDMRTLPYDTVLVSYLALCCQHLSPDSVTIASLSSMVAVSTARQFSSVWVNLMGICSEELTWFQTELFHSFLFQISCRPDAPKGFRFVDSFVDLLQWSYSSAADPVASSRCMEEASIRLHNQIATLATDKESCGARLRQIVAAIENYVMSHHNESTLKYELGQMGGR